MITNTKYHRITRNSPSYFRNPLKLIYIIITKPIDSINKYQIYNPSIDYQTSTTRNLSFVANQRTSSGRSFRRKPNFPNIRTHPQRQQQQFGHQSGDRQSELTIRKNPNPQLPRRQYRVPTPCEANGSFHGNLSIIFETWK